MRRREFLGGLSGAAAAWPLAAHAQQGERVRRIGIVDDAPIWDHFRQGLRDLGYIEGRNISIVYQTAEGIPERLAAAAAELVRLPVDVIAVFGTPPSLAAKRATETIPIVAIGIGDPVRAGLIASLARPGGNITGNIVLGPLIVSKRLQLLRDVFLSVSRVAFLWNPDNASNVIQFEEVQRTVPILGLKLISVEVRSPNEFDNTFAAMMRERPDAFMMTSDPLHQLHAGWIIEFVGKSRLPAMFQLRENVVAGGLMSYGASLPHLFRNGAGFVHKILQGAKPADLPVEQPVTFELVVNLKTAKSLGLTIPESILLHANEVIE
jgi:putative tryptophan/tyrosine transport system substrate-binding protein